MRAHSRGVRGDSVLCLLQYACLKLSKPGLAPRPWHLLHPSLCQCQPQLGTAPDANARLSLAHGNACSPLERAFFFLHCFLPYFVWLSFLIFSSFVLDHFTFFFFLLLSCSIYLYCPHCLGFFHYSSQLFT